MKRMSINMIAVAAVAAALAADTYDHRVQYLESSGTQFIDTGIIPSWDTTFTATYLVDYLEATGTQYVDTGLLATSNMQTDVGYSRASRSSSDSKQEMQQWASR